MTSTMDTTERLRVTVSSDVREAETSKLGESVQLDMECGDVAGRWDGVVLPFAGTICLRWPGCRRGALPGARQEIGCRQKGWAESINTTMGCPFTRSREGGCDILPSSFVTTQALQF